MNRYNAFIYIGLLLLLYSSCTEETNEMKYNSRNEKGRICFAFNPFTISIEEKPLSRSITDIPEDIKQLWCVVEDTKGNVLRSFHLTGADTKKLYLEGIEPGNYTAYFMATTENISLDTTVPEDVTQPWISHSQPGLPFEKDYLYKKIEFSVSPDLSSQTIDVKLPRLTGRVEVSLNLSNPQLEQLIQKVEVVSDKKSKVSRFMLGNGTYGGEDILAPLDVTKGRFFFSLPGGNLSGTVRITQKRTPDSEETSIVDYHFDNLDIIPGCISVIRLDYSHAEESYGEIKVKESSYTADNSSTMFQSIEPASTIVTRQFRVNEPLNVSIDTHNKQLVARLYSPMELKDTEVWIKFKKYSEKYFLLAHYDIIHPFQESVMQIPVMSKECKFTAYDGEQVWIPAQEDLSMSNCELKIIYTDTPYIQKVKSIKCMWQIGFQKAYEDTLVKPMVIDMKPDIARHICVLAVNIAYMFSSDYFASELNKLNGLYDDSKKPVDKNALMNNLLDKEKFHFGILEYNLLAQGYTLTYRIAMYPEYYTSFYVDHESYQSRVTFFHELGHSLGYGHNSNMTQDNGGATLWPVFCMDRFQELCYRGELPVVNDIVSGLPR